jgi:uncharacterized lipoprotein YmbA
VRRLVVLAALMALAGCTSPEPHYYTLEMVPGQPVPGGPTSVELHRPGLAGYLDRSDVVHSSANYTVTIANLDRWGEPFGDMITRVLAQDLTQRLPGTAVFTPAGSLSAEPGARIDLDIQRFDVVPGARYGTVVLEAQFAVTLRAGRRTDMQPLRAEEPVGGPGSAQQAAAMSRALGQLAQALAGALRGQGAISSR